MSVQEFIHCVYQGNEDYVRDHVSEIDIKTLKQMKLAASRKGYDEIVQIIQDELDKRS